MKGLRSRISTATARRSWRRASPGAARCVRGAHLRAPRLSRVRPQRVAGGYGEDSQTEQRRRTEKTERLAPRGARRRGGDRDRRSIFSVRLPCSVSPCEVFSAISVSAMRRHQVGAARISLVRPQPVRQLWRLGGGQCGARVDAFQRLGQRALGVRHGWSREDAVISAACRVSQNDDRPPTITVLPTNAPVFFCTASQRSRSSSQATSRAAGLAISSRSRAWCPAFGPRGRAHTPSSVVRAPGR